MKCSFLVAILCLSSLASASLEACGEYDPFSIREIEGPDVVVPSEPLFVNIIGNLKKEITTGATLKISAQGKEYESDLYSFIDSTQQLMAVGDNQEFYLHFYLPVEADVDGREINVKVEAFMADESHIFCLEGPLKIV